MGIKTIMISDKTKELIKNQNINLTISDNNEVEIKAFLSELGELKKTLEKYKYESLYAAFLQDLDQSLIKKSEKKPDKEDVTGRKRWFNKILFTYLFALGVLLAAHEGFEGMMSIINSLSVSISVYDIASLPILLPALFFAGLSVVIFYAFDLAEISSNLGVGAKQASKLTDLYLEEAASIKAIIKRLNSLKNEDDADLGECLEIANALKEKREAILEAGRSLNKSLKHPILQGTKILIAIMAGAMFFSGGFFGGQTVALIIASFFTASVAPTFWPVIVAGVVIGVAALSVYWFVERPKVQNLFSRLIGLDKEKIDQLCDEKAYDKQMDDIESLIKDLEVKQGDQGVKEQNNVLKDENAKLEAEIEELKKEVKMLRQRGDSTLSKGEKLSNSKVTLFYHSEESDALSEENALNYSYD